MENKYNIISGMIRLAKVTYQIREHNTYSLGERLIDKMLFLAKARIRKLDNISEPTDAELKSIEDY